MKIIVLMLTLVILFFNLYSYKSYFKSAKLRQLEFKESLNEHEDKEREKGILFLALTFFALLYFVFYIIAGSVFGNGLLLLYGVYMALYTIYSYFATLKTLVEEELPNKRFLWRIELPINTAYIVYFLFYYLNR